MRDAAIKIFRKFVKDNEFHYARIVKEMYEELDKKMNEKSKKYCPAGKIQCERLSVDSHSRRHCAIEIGAEEYQIYSVKHFDTCPFFSNQIKIVDKREEAWIDYCNRMHYDLNLHPDEHRAFIDALKKTGL